ncbi:hypothetical protein HU200_064769 [Digitaria exilis]|uniref:Uncharacterized protein n=1 Tax=Digitaria exilis TaxID=1010633 RepID=A0A835DUE0_9POAL|nr:hypothetical protein HU200_064769 [Digitaria exilis]
MSGGVEMIASAVAQRVAGMLGDIARERLQLLWNFKEDPLSRECPLKGINSPWVSVRPSPDAPRRLHLVELRANAKGLSSLAQAPAASRQTRLEGLARLQAPDYNTWCVQAPSMVPPQLAVEPAIRILPNHRLIRCLLHGTVELVDGFHPERSSAFSPAPTDSTPPSS